MKIVHRAVHMKILSVSRGSSRSCQGVGLIEVLIAALVLAVGVLGYVGLQINAKRLNFEATQRTTAVYLAQNILERMRGNPAALDEYVVTNLDPGVDPKVVVEPRNCTTDSCIATDLAAFDIWEWGQLLDGAAVSGGLVNPRACVENTGNYLTVTIVWQGKTPLNQENAPSCGDVDDFPDGLELRQWVTFNTFVADV